jgi:hypothetical protein
MAATEAPSRPDVPEILERERRTRTPVGIAALVAAVLSVVSGVLPQSIYSDFPRVYLIDALKDSAGEDIGREGLRTAQVLFIHDKAGSLLIVAVAQALAVLLIAYVLVFLHRAATDRGATTPKIARLLAMLGGVCSAVGALLVQIGLMVESADFANSSDHSTAAAHDALHGGAVVAGSFLGFFGGLSLAAAFVLICIGAMRVGLLTRFAGVLGAIVGVLFVLGGAGVSSSTFIVEAFWLLMAGALILGKWPNGVPPAWTSGEAMPWPSQQEIREQRAAARAARGGGGRAPAPPKAPMAPAEPSAEEPRSEAPSPATSARKKRKRRS